MKEFIDKLINELEKLGEHCLYMNNWQGQTAICDAIEIVNELAEEFATDINVGTKVSEMPTGWIPVSKRLPSESGKYLVTAKNITGWWILENNVFVCDYAYDTFIFQGWEDNEVIAWCELPAPYTEGE